jgi:hypothetical protein
MVLGSVAVLPWKRQRLSFTDTPPVKRLALPKGRGLYLCKTIKTDLHLPRNLIELLVVWLYS